MRKMLFALAALAALALLAPNSGVAQIGYNNFGIYTTETPDFSNITSADTQVNGAFIQHTAYVVCSYPYNTTLDAGITNLGGYEFRIEAGSLTVIPTLPPSATNFVTPPDYLCGANIPVVNNMCTVATLVIASFAEDPVPLYLTPISEAIKQSIPGAIALTDADNEFALFEAYPASGDFANPIFGFNTSVVANEDASWSDVKSLYR